jgi:Family of unknown function (DUF6279)
MTAGLRATRLALIAAAVAVLVSCSFTKFAYNQADTVALWTVDEYFSLEGVQRDEFNKRFQRFYSWHRYEQLPEYAQFMRAAHDRMQAGISREDVLWFSDGLKTRVRTMARKGAPEAAALLATLTPAQVENLQRKLDKENRKYLRERKVNGTLEERQEAEAKRIIKQIEEWLAPLDDGQERRITALARELPQLERERYADRLRRQKEFVELLTHRNEDPQRFTARVTEWMVNWDKGRSPEYQRQLDASRQKRAELFVAADRMLTTDQRKVALRRVNGYVEDFTHLASRSDGSRTALR